MKRKYIFSLFLFLFSISIVPVLFSQEKLDNIQLSLEKLDKKSRLKFLVERANANDLVSIENLEKEAIKQNDDLRLAQAYYLKQVHYQFIENAEDSLSSYYAKLASEKLKILQKYTETFDKEELKIYQSVKTNIAYSIVKTYLSENKYELALYFLNDMLEDNKSGNTNFLEYDIYSLLGICYMHAQKPQQAFDSFKKGYEIYNEYSKPNEPYGYSRFFEGMSHALMKLKDYEEMILLNNKLEEMISKEYEQTGSEQYPYHISKFNVRSQLAHAFIMLGNLSLAREKLDDAKKIALDNFWGTAYTCNYYEVEIQYYIALKNYAKAKEYLDLYLECTSSKKEFEGVFYYIESNLVKADFLYKSGNSDKAYELLTELYQLNDSITAINYSNQIAEIQTLYKVDKLENESEQNKLKVRIILYALIGSVLISLLLTYIIYTSFKNSKILKEKNKRLLQQYSELDNRNKIITDLQSSKLDDSASNSGEVDPYQSLVSRLDAYLKESQIYRKSGLTREELALDMGTNRQYLIEAIKEKTGKTFNEYIYSYRLKYAYDQITKEPDKPISEIYFEAGFQTKGTFNRAFKEIYGMTPSELRNAIQ